MINYHKKRFRVVDNSENGNVSLEMIFTYFQEGNMLSCDYSGSEIKKGQLLGIVANDGKIDMKYQQINNNNELQTGICSSTPEILANGKIRLHEIWRWTNGDLSIGTSTLQEL